MKMRKKLRNDVLNVTKRDGKRQLAKITSTLLKEE